MTKTKEDFLSMRQFITNMLNIQEDKIEELQTIA